MTTQTDFEKAALNLAAARTIAEKIVPNPPGANEAQKVAAQELAMDIERKAADELADAALEYWREIWTAPKEDK